MVFDHCFGEGNLKREDVKWSRLVDAAKADIFNLCNRWLEKLDSLSCLELISSKYTK